MTSARLEACPACARHVRVSESACPFCSAALPAAFGSRAVPRAPSGRLGRAALYALGASTVALAAACSSGGEVAMPVYGAPSPPLDAGDGEASSPDAGAPDAYPTSDGGTPAYGGPGILNDASDEDAAFHSVDAAYGAPPLRDAGPADAASDAPHSAPVYGAPPIDAGRN